MAIKKRTLSGAIAKSNAGRPTKLYDEEIVRKLEQILKIDGTIDQACSYAGISRETYYHWLEISKDFSTKMQSAQHYPLIAAKHVVVNSITNDKDSANAKWFLERREAKNYSTSPTMLQQINAGSSEPITIQVVRYNDAEEQLAEGSTKPVPAELRRQQLKYGVGSGDSSAEDRQTELDEIKAALIERQIDIGKDGDWQVADKPEVVKPEVTPDPLPVKEESQPEVKEELKPTVQPQPPRPIEPPVTYVPPTNRWDLDNGKCWKI